MAHGVSESDPFELPESSPLAILYARVSTEDQGSSGLGLDAQRGLMIAAATYRQWRYTALEDVQSAKTLDRPGLQLALQRLKKHEAQTLMVARLDRLTRSVKDFAELLHRAAQEKWSIVALDVDVDTTTAGGELVAHLMASVAQWERKIIADRTRLALRQLRDRGVRLGRPPIMEAKVEQAILSLHQQGLNYPQMVRWLTDKGYPPPSGVRWHHRTIQKALRRLGAFEELEAS